VFLSTSNGKANSIGTKLNRKIDGGNQKEKTWRHWASLGLNRPEPIISYPILQQPGNLGLHKLQGWQLSYRLDPL